MAQDLKVSLLLADEGFRQRLQEDANTVKQMGDSSSDAAKSLANMVGGLVTATQQGTNYRKQLGQITRTLTDMTVNYRNLTEAEKQSRFGQGMLQTINELTNKAAEFKDAMGDVQAEIIKTSSDTQNWDALAGSIDLVSSAMQTYVSLTGDANGKNEEAVAVIASLAKIQAVANAAIKVTNLLQKNSALMVGIRRIQEAALNASLKANTVAETTNSAAVAANTTAEGANAAATATATAATVAQTTATKGATVAQAAFNLVAKANPYVLLAAAVIGVGTALVAFAMHSKKAAEEEKKAQKEAELLKKKQEELRHEYDTLGAKTGDLVGTFKVLQTQWKNLKTEAQKKEWIKANKTEFNKLGVEVNNVNDAYDVFVKNAPKVIAALKAIAEAEAFKDLYKESITKREKEWNQRSKSTGTGDYYTKYDTSTEEVGIDKTNALKKNSEWQNAGIGLSDIEYSRACGQVTSYYKLNQQGIDKINKYRNAQALALNAKIKKTYDDEVNHYASSYDEAIKKAEKAKAELASTGVKTTDGNSNGGNDKPEKKTVDFEVGSLSDIEAKISDLQKKLKDTNWTIKPAIEKDKLMQDIAALEVAKRNLEDALEIDVNDSQLTKLQKELSKNEEMLKITPNLSEEDIKTIQTRIEKLKKDVQNEKIRLGLEDPRTILADLQDELKKAQKKLEITPDLSEEDIRNINNRIAQLKSDISAEKIRLGIEVDTSAIDLSDFKQDVTVTQNIKTQNNFKKNTNPQYENKAQKADSNAQALNEELRLHQQLVSSYKKEYDAIMNKVNAGVQLNANEKELKDQYEAQINNVNALAEAYAKASVEAAKLNAEAQLRQATVESITGSVDALGNMNSAVQGVYSSWKSLGEQWNEMNDFEKTVNVISNCVSTLQSLASVIQSVNTIIELFNSLTAASTAVQQAKATADAEEAAIIQANSVAKAEDVAMTEADIAAKTEAAVVTDVLTGSTIAETASVDASAVSKGVEAGATTAQAVATGALAGAETAEASADIAAEVSTAAAEAATIPGKLAASAANQVLTATENTAAYAAIPFAGPGLAAAAQAVYQGLWAAAAIPMFSGGGIFEGPTSMGDFNIARVNDGEMILNNSEQGRLFRLLNGTLTLGPQETNFGVSDFEIKGTSLVGVFKNVDKKRNKLL